MSSVMPDDDDRTVLRAPRAPAAEPAPAPDSGNALPPGTRLGEFELTRVIGEGGFGIVYEALDHSLQRRVAVKEYMPSALAARSGATGVAVKSARYRETFDLGLKSFVNEARLLAQFDHPSLVKVFRFWEGHGTAYMAMPFYEGITLKDKLRELGAPPDEAWLTGLLAPLTEALAVIHAEQCFHRDIAPDNIILLAGSGRPLLLDFGAARRVIGDMTQALTVILKPGYAPIEQYAEVPGLRQGPWTDVYALAAVVYYAIAGRTPPASVGRMVNDSYEPLAVAAAGRYSARLLQAVDHALGVRPEQRTPSIAALRSEIGLPPLALDAQETRPMAEPLTALAAPPPRAAPQQAAAPRGTRRGLLWGGIGVAALAAAGYGAFRLLAPAPPAAAAPAVAAIAPAPAPPTQPAPLVATAAPPAPPRVFSIGDEFERMLQGQAFRVEATPAKPQLRIGRDRLSFRLASERDGRYYVLVKGPDGSLIVLMPNRDVADNRIRAGQPLTLPPPSWPLDTFEPTGVEDFLVVVSSAERDFGAIARRNKDGFLELPTGDKAAALAREHAGPGSVLAGRARCEGAGCDTWGAARFAVEIVR